MIKEKELSPVEVVEAYLRRIEEVNPLINAYCTVAAEQARAAAKEAEAKLSQNEELGPLHGVPVSIKDLTETAGIRTTFGSRIFENYVPQQDAIVVERLKAAGAIVLGKTNTPEFGAGANTFNAVFGPTGNPWRLNYTPAGSSGGAASALAAGLCPLAGGSDLGGSLRTPASFCGVVGLRPSIGRVPSYPSQMVWDSMGVDGPMARTVEDTALMLSVMAGRDDRVPMSQPADPDEFLVAVREPEIKGWKVAFSPDLGFAPVEQTVVDICRKAVEVFSVELGCAVEEASPDLHDAPAIFQTLRAYNMVTNLGQHLERWRDQMQKNLVWNVEQGYKLSALDVGKAQQARSALWQRARQFFKKYDLLLVPAAATLPFPFETISPPEIAGRKMENYVEWLGITYGITVAGLPSIVVPVGWSEDGLPVGMQIVGRRLDEASILRAAAAFQQVRPWQQRRPPLQ
jgi:amidase